MSTTATEGIPHLRKQGPATQLVVHGRPFVMLGGEVHNSSASSLEYMEPIWDRLKALHLNTVLVTASWELVEPQEGRFDLELITGLIEAARRRGLKLVFLWFGTWKNAVSTYAPGWVKTDLGRFPRAETAPGRKTGHITCMSDEACRADARAFAALMRHIREVDGDEQTVITVQVENEVGLLGAPRDRCPQAEEAFARPVPDELTKYVQDHEDALLPELWQPWQTAGGRTGGIWAEVFGEAADEVFMAWHVARYVDCVAAAGKAEHPLPMYANAWLVAHDGQEPGKYPSGGPVARMMDVWRAAAPHIDYLAPDIYRPDFSFVCREYTQSGNPLMIPEARRDDRAAANAWYAFAEHDAICFAPFAIDDLQPDHPLGKTYELLEGMIPILGECHGRGRMAGFLQEGPAQRELDLGGYRFHVRFTEPPGDGSGPGAGLLITLGRGELIAAGQGFVMTFSARPGEPPNVEFLAVEEGRFENGQWRPRRRLNGDEYYAGVILKQPGIRKFSLYGYD
jgi:hypothetical protein